MTSHAERVELDPECPARGVREAAEKVKGGGEVVLEFGGVLRMDAAAAKALEELAGVAEGCEGRIVLRGVKIGIYRVLKQLRLERRVTIVCE